MSSYLAVLTGADTTSSPQSVALTVFPNNGQKPGDKLLSAVVIAQGSGAIPVGTDITSLFGGAGTTYQVIPNAKNIAVNGVAGGAGGVGIFCLLQPTGSNLAGATILALMDRAGG